MLSIHIMQIVAIISNRPKFGGFHALNKDITTEARTIIMLDQERNGT